MTIRLPIIIDDGRLKEIPSGDQISPGVLQALIDDSAAHPDKTFSSEYILNLLYPFNITSFTASPSVAELGSTVSTIGLSWATNYTPSSVSLNNGIGAITPATTTSYSHTGQTVTTDRTYTLTAERNGVTKTANAVVRFYNRIYYGVNSTQTTSGSVISTFTSVLSNTRQRTITFNCTGGRYFHLAYPVRLGTATFTINNLAYSDVTLNTINLTNSFGYTEPYYVYYCNVIQYGSSIPLVVN